MPGVATADAVVRRRPGGCREALKRTAVALKQGDVDFALAGGYAAWALGGPEPEHDVDFVVAEQERGRCSSC